MNLTVIGTVYVDIKGYPIGSFVPAGRNAGRVEQFQGGVGRNIAEDVRNLGVDTTFISLVDESGIGKDVLDHLDSCGINTKSLWATKDGMGTWLAIFTPEGEVCANISKRPNLMPICDILDQDGDEIFKASDGILLEIDMDEEIIAKTMKLAEKYQVPVYAVISNMTIAKERLEYIKQTDCFICNRQEAGIFFEENVEEYSMGEMLILLKKQIAKLGLKRMVVTMDADGAVYAAQEDLIEDDKAMEESVGIIPAKRVKVIDTTGAGDSFFAGVSAELASGKSLKEACIKGTEMAAKVIASGENVYLV